MCCILHYLFIRRMVTKKELMITSVIIDLI
jgi:hypothetical protein